MTHLIESLLRSLEVDPALVGDLLEQHHAGRSTRWFMRQGIIAAASACSSRWLSHPVLALRSLLVGAAAVFLLSKAAWFPMQATTRLFGLTVGNYLLDAHHDGLRQVFMMYHLYDLPFVLFTCVAYGVAGWAVARTLGQHQLAMVVLFALAVQVWWAYGLVVHVHDAMLFPRANLYPYMEAVAFVLLAPAILLGGQRAAATS